MALNPREKKMVYSGAVAVALILGYLILAPVLYRKARWENEMIPAREKDLVEMKLLAHEVAQLKQQVRDLPAPPADFSLFSYLESVAGQAGIKLDSLKPGPNLSEGGIEALTMDVKIRETMLAPLKEFLYNLEVGGKYPLMVRKFHAKRSFKDINLLEVSFQVIFYQPSKGV